MSAFVLSKIFPSMSIDASQRFIFGLEESPEPLGSFKLDNIFVPTLGSPSLTNFEMRNEALSGYRWIHRTASTETYGSFKLQKFLTASPTGIDIITFNDDGTFVFPGTTDAKYILQTANTNLPNAQSLGALTSGILKNTVTTGTGVLSVAVAGTDYYAPHKPTTLIDDFNLNGNINDSYGNLGVGEKVFNALTLSDPDDTYNLAVGAAALYAFTGGWSNTAIGQYAMMAFETGDDNTGVGYWVASNFQNGSNNTILGSVAAASLLSGDFNLIAGKGAGYNLPGGNRNTILGTDAFVGATVACNDNTVIGYNAASNQTTYNACILIGKNADTLADNLTNAIAIGGSVGASDSMVLGGATMKVGIRTNTPSYPLDVVGTGGIAISVNTNRIIEVADPVDLGDAVNKGYLEDFVIDVSEAKFIIQTADADLPNAQVLGSLASGILKSATTTGVLSIATAGTDYYSPLNPATLTCNAVSQNAGFSRNAYSSLTSGTGNAIFNVFGGQVLTSGTGNVILAGNTGGALTTGSSNILIGNTAGDPLSTGNSNVLIGVSAGSSLTSPNFNVIIGASAGSALQTGASNVCVGTSAGVWGGGGFASYDHCVFLGREAQPSVSNLTNAIAIGYLASVSANNSMVLGNGVNVGMGTSDPSQAKCVVSGGVANVASEESCLRVISSTNSAKIELQNTTVSTGRLYELRSNNVGTFELFDRTSAASRIYVNASGYVGLNTTSPTTGRIVANGGPQNVSNEETVFRGISGLNNVKIELQATGGSGKLYEIRSANNGSFDITDRTGATTRFSITSGGNVGIGMGTSTPNGKLQLSNTITNRQFVLWEQANNDFQFHGFGSIAGGLGYNINGTGDSHVFFAGASSSSRNEVARILGTGGIRVPRVLGNAGAPSVAGGTAAGSSPGLTIAGSEVTGTIQVTVGSAPSGTTIVIFTLGSAMPNSTYGVNITPANSTTAALATESWIDVTSTTQFTLSNATALVTGNVYKWNYQIMGC